MTCGMHIPLQELSMVNVNLSAPSRCLSLAQGYHMRIWCVSVMHVGE